jgi:hypothetical protein
MIGIINDPRVAVEIGTLFGGASGELRDNASDSLTHEEEGQRATREETYTDEIVRQMRGAIDSRLREISGRLSNLGTDVKIEFHPTQLPVEEERKYGADIGIRVTIRTSETISVKGILIQCKRMYGPKDSPSYPELRGRGERQANDMLRITPASFFMLFNFGSQEELLNYTSIPIGMMCPLDENAPISPEKRSAIGSNCPIWAKSAGSIWDLGIAMLPATRVLFLSAGSVIKNTVLPIQARKILRGALPLGVFMVDLFASCFVGDPRQEIVRLVTPPKLRNEYFPVTGLHRTDFRWFAVRHYIDVLQNLFLQQLFQGRFQKNRRIFIETIMKALLFDVDPMALPGFQRKIVQTLFPTGVAFSLSLLKTMRSKNTLPLILPSGRLVNPVSLARRSSSSSLKNA